MSQESKILLIAVSWSTLAYSAISKIQRVKTNVGTSIANIMD
jgi:hypothetical protein